MTINILSQNVMCWGRLGKSTYRIRRPLLNNIFHNHGADILCMQEVTPDWKDFFDKDLADFEKVFMYRNDKSPEAVPVYWKSDKFNALDIGNFWLSETPEKESLSWNSAYTRIASWAHLKDLHSDKDFVVINTHLDNVSAEARINGIQLICDFIKDKFCDKMPVILTGDFNATPNSETIQKANSLLIDTRSVAIKTSSEITYHGYNSNNASIIDYIYINSNVKCNKFDVLKEFDHKKRPQSDHYAVFAELEI